MFNFVAIVFVFKLVQGVPIFLNKKNLEVSNFFLTFVINGRKSSRCSSMKRAARRRTSLPSIYGEAIYYIILNTCAAAPVLLCWWDIELYKQSPSGRISKSWRPRLSKTSVNALFSIKFNDDKEFSWSVSMAAFNCIAASNFFACKQLLKRKKWDKLVFSYF